MADGEIIAQAKLRADAQIAAQVNLLKQVFEVDSAKNNHCRSANVNFMGAGMVRMAQTLSMLTGIIRQSTGQEDDPITVVNPKHIEGGPKVIEGKVETPSDCEIIDVEFEDEGS